ncbi:MAG: HD domain-containing protein [Candidatus Hydrogenedentota bacterium]
MTEPANPRDFLERVLTLFERIHPLDRVARAGYVLRGVAEPESVAAHSHFVALLALLFLEAYPGRWNAERVLAMALTHDLAEAQLMDIPMPAADAHLKHVKRVAEQAITDDLLHGLPGGLAELHREYMDAATPEARLLRALDKAQMMIKILCYQREHRGALDEFWANPANFKDYGIGPVSELFEALCQRAGRSRPPA